MTIPIVRQRTKTSKTKTGCRTCRARHVKCDEQKPTCLRCIRSNKTCTGYEPLLRTRDALSARTVQPRLAQHSPSIPASPSEIILSLDERERFALSFFHYETIHELPGDGWLLSWERLALQASCRETAVMHAVVALGSLHLAGHNRQAAPVDCHLVSFALVQCNMAMAHARRCIQDLDEESSEAAVEVVLLLSLLLFCFEVWCGQDERAGLHLQTGLRILYERVRFRGKPESCDAPGKRIVRLQPTPRNDMDVLLQTFVRLDMDMTIHPRTDPAFFPYLHPLIEKQLPLCFASVDDAMVFLDAITVQVQSTLNEVLEEALTELRQQGLIHLEGPRFDCFASLHTRSMDLSTAPDLANRIREARTSVSHWMSAFASVSVTRKNESAHMLAQIQAFGLWHEISSAREADEMAHDSFEEQFEYILGVAERYVDMHYRSRAGRSASSNGRQSRDTHPAISLGSSLVSVVFVIGSKCRKARVRQRCIRLLGSINLRGVFDSDFVVALLDQVIGIEIHLAKSLRKGFNRDDYQCRDIPREARILDMNMTGWTDDPRFYKSGTGALVYALKQHDQIQVRFKPFVVARKAPSPKPSETEALIYNDVDWTA